MDNLTHSLIGLIAGEALSRVVPTVDRGISSENRRGLFIAATVVGGNLPDLDLVYSYRGPATDKLTYLLEHRGYTHTVLGCLLLALLLYGALEVWVLKRRIVARGADHLVLLGVVLFGTALHLIMDSLNSYGVHPFWPFQNRWYYGDSIYIVEPLYWAAAAPLIFLLRTRVARSFLGLVLLAAVVVSVASGQVPALMYLALIVFIALMLAVGWRRTARTAALASAAACVLITLSFMFAGQIAARRAQAMARADFPAARTIDHVLTPMPADPFCWDVLMLQTAGDRYVSRHAILALAPALIPAGDCRGSNIDRQTLVPQTAPTTRDATAVRWKEFSMSRDMLARLAASDCEAAALMVFARAPFGISVEDGWLMGDLRFDRGSKPGIADIRVRAHAPSPTQCPWIPPWEPPRQELLESPRLE